MKVRDQRVGLAVREDVAEIALPDAEARLGVELFPEGLAFLLCHLVGGARVGGMDKAAGSVAAAREDLGIAGPDAAHLLVGDLVVVQWRAPLRGALEHGQAAGGLGHFLDRLHRGGAGADHRDALAGEAHPFLGPVMGVAGLALERVDAWDARHGRRREHADGGNQQTCAVAPAILQHDVPAARFLAVMRGGDAALKLDVAAQVEPVGDMVQIALRLRLRGEALGPIPFLQQLRRKGVAVGIALRIEAGAGIAVPVPGAADAGAGLEDACLQAELAQLVKLVEAGNAGADDDRVKIRARVGRSLLRRRLPRSHAVIPCSDAFGKPRRGHTVNQDAAVARSRTASPPPSASRG